MVRTSTVGIMSNKRRNVSNLIDNIWSTTTGREPEPKGPIVVHELSFSGKRWQDKIADIRKTLSERKVDATIVTDLTEVAWLFNLRGSDIPYVPVFKAFAFVSQLEIRLYIKSLISESVRRHLNIEGCDSSESKCEKVVVLNYEDLYSEMKNLIKSSNLKVLLSPKSSFQIYSIIPKDLVVLEETPITGMMVVKNPTESDGMEKAMLRDSVVLVDFFSLLEDGILKGDQWDELSAAATLDKMRSKAEFSKGPSFETISAFGANAALAHYTPTTSTNKVIDESSLYLLDSGGQYLDGTTDVTRTFHFGKPTDLQKEAYTRVLQGSIDLAAAVFPSDSSSTSIEVLARQYLYNYGLDYNHGTGHGVGSYLSVHEYPPLISSPSPGNMVDNMEAGMFTSIEPGFYQEDDFGIRLETIFKITEAETKYKYNNVSYLKFQPVVFVPFEPKLIKTEMLTKTQITWLNNYNAKTLNVIGLALRKDDNERAYKWLIRKTPQIPLTDANNHSSLSSSSCGLILMSAFVLYLKKHF